ncbi:MAG TPA: hypothetical protein VGI74_27795 [Streptosporangiaceae bacterium]
MAIARFKDLCLDTTDTALPGAFWAEVLGLTWVPEADEERLEGPTEIGWLVLADPEGNEFCAFVEPPATGG